MNVTVMLGILALVTFGSVQFFRKVAGANQVYGPSYMAVSALCIALFGVSIHLVQGHPFQLSAQMTGLAALGGIIAGIAIFAMLLAFKLGGDGSVLFPIAGLGVVVAVILSIVVFNEPVTPAKLLGLGLGVASIIILSR